MERIVRKISSLSFLINRPAAQRPPPVPTEPVPAQEARRTPPWLPLAPPGPPGTGPITQLPTEILLQIFGHLLAAKDIGVATRVCRRWYVTALEILYRAVEIGRFGLDSVAEHKLFARVASHTFQNPELCAIVKTLTLRSQSFINSTYVFPAQPLSNLASLEELTWLAVDLVFDSCQGSQKLLCRLIAGLRLPPSIRKLHIGLRYYMNAERDLGRISGGDLKQGLPHLEEFRYSRIRLWSELVGKQQLVEEEAQGKIVAVNDGAAGELDKLGEMDKAPALFQVIITNLSPLTTLKILTLDCPLNPASFTYTLTPTVQQEMRVSFLTISSFLFPPNLSTLRFSLLDRQVTQSALRPHDKLLRLTAMQLHELSVDVSDEAARRIATTDDENAMDMPPCLPNVPNFHPRRNQARGKLATLAGERFVSLLIDMMVEIRTRFPRICTSQFVPAPEFPGSGRRGGSRAHKYVTERIYETLEDAGLRNVVCLKARMGTGDSEWVKVDVWRGDAGRVEVTSLVPEASAKVLNEGIKVSYSHGSVESIRRGILEEVGGGRWRIVEALEL